MLMFGVEAIISPPNSLGFTNQVEYLNGLWQNRTIGRWRYHSLEQLADDNIGFVHWANTGRAILDPALCGTRYPAEYVASHAPQLRWPPTGFHLDDYLDLKGNCRIPLSRGRLTFLRHVQAGHSIEIAQRHWTVSTALKTGALVVAAIDTGSGHLEIRHQGELTNRHHYPMQPATIDPYHPQATSGLLDHLPTMS